MKYRKFSWFFENNTYKTNQKYTFHELMGMNSIEGITFSTYVAESDVIWKNYWRENYFDEVFYLHFPAASGCKKVAYAPSLSSRQFNSNELNRFKSLVKDFVAISTRESQSSEYLTKELGKEVPNLLDPTLLLYANDYNSIAKEQKQEHYVLLYNCMENDKAMILEAERFASIMGLPLIEVSIWNLNRYLYKHRVITDAGIEEWIGWVKGADYVITNGFHGLCFSIIYEKDFFVFQRDESDYRMKSLVSLLGIEDRFITCGKKIIPEHFDLIDYPKILKILNSEREKSRIFISQYIVN